MGNVTTIYKGGTAIFEEDTDVQFATEKENRRESTLGGKDLNVVKVPYKHLRTFIKKMQEVADRHPQHS